jgi:hypothetical protein
LDLGDLSFTPQELEALQAAEAKEKQHPSPASSASTGADKLTREPRWWGKWIIERINS